MAVVIHFAQFQPKAVVLSPLLLHLYSCTCVRAAANVPISVRWTGAWSILPEAGGRLASLNRSCCWIASRASGAAI